MMTENVTQLKRPSSLHSDLHLVMELRDQTDGGVSPKQTSTRAHTHTHLLSPEQCAISHSLIVS